jgi:hypothetical protein
MSKDVYDKEGNLISSELEDAGSEEQEVNYNERLDYRKQFMEGIADQLDAEEGAREKGSDNGYLIDDTEEEEQEEFIQDDEPVVEQAPTKHKVKINGVEREFTTEELYARAAKVEAADDYLAKAAASYHQAQANINSNTSRPSQADVRDSGEEDFAEIARSLQMGTEEEAAEAIRKLVQRPSVNPDVVVRQVEEKLQFQKAAEQFQQEYSDILGDPMLRQLAISKDEQLTRAGDNRPYLERYKEIGDELRGWKQSMTQSNQAETKSVQKQQRKQTMNQVPTAAMRNGYSRDNTGEQEENTSDVIAQLAAARRGRNI